MRGLRAAVVAAAMAGVLVFTGAPKGGFHCDNNGKGKGTGNSEIRPMPTGHHPTSVRTGKIRRHVWYGYSPPVQSGGEWVPGGHVQAPGPDQGLPIFIWIPS